VASDAIAAEHLEELFETKPGLWGQLTTVDHKIIGKRYLFTAIIFLIVGGIEALIMRLQLAGPNMQILGPEAYNQFFTMHGTTMIFWYASPILAGFGNYLVPLMIGSRDMALPRTNAFSYWTFLLSGLFLYASLIFLNAPHAGWYEFANYTLIRYSPGLGTDFWDLALALFTISTSAGGVNFIVTIFHHRAPGMSIGRMPLFMYSTLTTYFSAVFAGAPLMAALIFLELDRKWGFHFYDPAMRGHVLLWQMLFWFFAHPWVYIIFLPATGLISMMVPIFSRHPIVGYPYIAIATILTGVVGFGVWLHHMFVTGQPNLEQSYFSAASMTISIFTAIQVFAWVATFWKGKPVLTTACLFIFGFIALLVIGGLNGIVGAVVPVDWQITQTYFIPAHIHYVLIGANLFPVMAAFYCWLPKMTGHMLNEVAGKISFWFMFIGTNVTFFPMHLLGIFGMPRRIFTYPAGMGWSSLNLVATIGAFILAAGFAISLVSFFVSLKVGKEAGDNPWYADGLEWSTSSPPPEYNFLHLPTVISRHPLWDDYDEMNDPNNERLFDEDRLTLTTTWKDAEPVAVARMAEDTIAPLLLALTLTAIICGIVITNLWVALAGVCASLLAEGYWLWPKHPPKVLLEPQKERVLA
jgi:cytochrome c oxidase subunit I